MVLPVSYLSILTLENVHTKKAQGNEPSLFIFNPIYTTATLKLIPEVVRYPHFEVPYPQLKRRQQSLGALVAVVRPFRYIYL